MMLSAASSLAARPPTHTAVARHGDVIRIGLSTNQPPRRERDVTTAISEEASSPPPLKCDRSKHSESDQGGECDGEFHSLSNPHCSCPCAVSQALAAELFLDIARRADRTARRAALSLWGRSPFAFAPSSAQVIENTQISFWIGRTTPRPSPLPRRAGDSGRRESKGPA
jgi:hypothetical protein